MILLLFLFKIFTTALFGYVLLSFLDLNFRFYKSCLLKSKAVSMSSTHGSLPKWPVKVLSNVLWGDGSVPPPSYRWSYGTRKLIAEQERVREIERLRGMFLNGLVLNPYTNEGILKVPLSFQESFVGTDVERITLMDRVRSHYNYHWRREVASQVEKVISNPDMKSKVLDNWGAVAHTRFDILMQTLHDLQALVEELKSETRELIKCCESHEQLVRCMMDANA